jgi:hypothetical protein
VTLGHRAGIVVGVLVVLALAGVFVGDAEAAIVKRVQTGTTTVATTATTGTTALLSYAISDTAKTFIICTQRSSNQNGRNIATCDIQDSTHVVLRQGAGTTSTVTVDWTVVEFSEGVTVERKTVALGTAASTNVTLTNTFTCASSFVVLSGHRTTNGTNASTDDQQYYVRANLGTSATPCTAGTSTNLYVERQASGTDLTVVVQVVQYDGATVQRGTSKLTMANSTTATTASITSVDTTKSLLLFSYSPGAGAGGIEQLYLTRGNFTSGYSSPFTSTGLTFARAASTTTTTATVDINWEVVTFNDGTTVQHNTSISGNAFSTAGSTTLAVPLAAVDRTVAVPFHSFAGAASTSTTVNVNDINSAQITGPTALTFSRATLSTTIEPTVNWSVVSFYKCSGTPLCHVGAVATANSITAYWAPNVDVSTTTGTGNCASTTLPAALAGTCNALVVIAQIDGSGTITGNFAPVDGTVYTVGKTTGGATCSFAAGSPTAAAPCVLSNNATNTVTSTVTQGSLVSGKRYVIKVFPKLLSTTNTFLNNVTNNLLTASNSEISLTTQTGSVGWVYAATGGASMNSPISAASADHVFLTSNGNKVTVLNSAGTEVATPIITNGAPQGRLNWFPISGSGCFASGAEQDIVGTDDKGFVFSLNAGTGAMKWRKLVDTPLTFSGFASPAAGRPTVTVQIYDCSDFNPLPVPEPTSLTLSGTTGTITATAAFGVFTSADVGQALQSGTGSATITGFTSSTQVTASVTSAFSSTSIAAYNWTLPPHSFQSAMSSQFSYSGDVLYVTTRGGGTTANKVVALKATDGTTLWTFDPNGSGVGNMDQIDSEPQLDYSRNRLHVTSEAGAGDTSAFEYWIIDTTNTFATAPSMFVDQVGQLTAARNPPVTSWDDMTLYVGTFDGNLRAFNLGPVSSGLSKWSFSTGATTTGEPVGFPWEDINFFGRLYLTTADGNAWCVNDNGSSATKCGVSPDVNTAWTTNPRKAIGAGLGTGNTGTGTAAEPMLLDYFFLSGSDGLLYQLDTQTGSTLKTFTLESGTVLGDLSTDGNFDKLYVGTTGGRVYRYNLTCPDSSLECPGGTL